MQSRQRRTTLLSLLMLSTLPLCAAGVAGPRFRAGGPDAARYGQAEGYPKGPADHDDPDMQRHIVGASTHFAELFPTHAVAHAKRPSRFRRATVGPDVHYERNGRRYAMKELLDHLPVTGLLLLRDDTIVAEEYQYGRSDHDRFSGNSMTKTVVSLLIGVAVAEHRIASIDDPAARYVPVMKGSAYGETTLRALLSMSSGVALDEDRYWKEVFTAGADTGAILARLGTRLSPAGSKFKYSSGDSEVLTTVLRHAVGVPLSQYLAEKIWKPIGAESDAAWAVESADQEIGPWGFNATLRDYARMGRLLAYDGAWNGRQLVPAAWVQAMTTIRPEDRQVAPGTASHYYGYGYQLWVLPGERRMVALLGACGQYVFVDPQSKLVMVQTAVRLDDENVASRHSETLALWLAVVKQLG